jgi:hypothetical protein
MLNLFAKGVAMEEYFGQIFGNRKFLKFANIFTKVVIELFKMLGKYLTIATNPKLL